jgi:divinyl protochlorophyllide a 8-vinyl-reductase
MSASGTAVNAGLAPAVTQGLIGPNAITRMDEALVTLQGAAVRNAVFRRAGLMRHVLAPPEAMIPDEDGARLHRAVLDELGYEAAQAAGRDAGRRTAAYLLANRIPRQAQAVLRLLPPRLALALLLKAISKHSWTFAGAGRFSYRTGPVTTLVIEGGPVARGVRCDGPACAFYAETFQALFRAIVSSRADVREVECQAAGGTACRFEVRLS